MTPQQKKLLGAYYTPRALAEAVVRLCPSDAKTVLEPACGEGVFLDALPFQRIDAVEINPDAARIAADRHPNARVFIQDFLTFTGDNYDLVIGNPPYVRWQRLSETQKERQRRIFPGSVNLWIAFTAHCVTRLSPAGTLALILPAELVRDKNAAPLRRLLAESFTGLTVVNVEKSAFPDIKQNVVILIGSRRESGFRILDHNLSVVCSADAPPAEEWIPHAKLLDLPFPRLNARVGITTGCNRFFIPDNATLTRYALPSRPLFSGTDGLFFADDRRRLVVFPDNAEENPLWREYIQQGEAQNVHLRYKCRIRPRWHVLSPGRPPDAFLQRRCNAFPRLTLNRCNALASDATLALYNFPPENAAAFYNSATFACVELLGKPYGDGVLELFPGDMKNLPVPDIRQLSQKAKDELTHEVHRLLTTKENIEKVLDLVDGKILSCIYGFSTEIIQKYRNIWRKNKLKRLNLTTDRQKYTV